MDNKAYELLTKASEKLEELIKGPMVEHMEVPLKESAERLVGEIEDYLDTQRVGSHMPGSEGAE